MTTCQALLSEIAESCRNILGGNLVGVYVHGSIAFGCFNWEKSDVDYITVVEEPLDTKTRRALMDQTVRLNRTAPPKGLEMSVVRRAVCRPFVYPTPFELHYSNMHKEWFQRDPEDYCERMRGVDRDLAAHFTVIGHVGITLCGESAGDVFGEVPREDYLDSIRNDMADAEKDILSDPMYVVLTMCRVAAFARDGLVLSKRQGGEWGLRSLGGEQRALVQRALDCYAGGEKMEITPGQAREYIRCLSGWIGG